MDHSAEATEAAEGASGPRPRAKLLRGTTTRLRKALDGGREAQHDAEISRLEACIGELESEVVEMRVKVDCRDMAISSLERTAEMQGSAVQALHLELEEARQAQSNDVLLEEEIEALRSDMEDMQMMHERQEEELRSEADRLRKRVHDKKKLVVSLTKKLTECQKYIGELTDELERVYEEQEEVKSRERRGTGETEMTSKTNGIG